MIDIDGIQRLLPHRYPFLLLDRVIELEPGKRGVAIKNVTANEPQFQGHFPGRAIMPGVLIAEAFAQLGGVIAFTSRPEMVGHDIYLLGFDKMRFRRPVRPGDQLRLEASVEFVKRGIWSFDCAATVDGERAAEGKVMATVDPG